MSEKINNTEREYASVEDSLNMRRIPSNETTLISEIPNIIIEENVLTAAGQKTVLRMSFVKSKHFLTFFLRVDFGYSASRNISANPARYFNQKLLNFKKVLCIRCGLSIFCQVCV